MKRSGNLACLHMVSMFGRLGVLGVALVVPRFAVAEEPAAVPTATPDKVRQSVEHAIGWLQAESSNWMKTRKCAACHHVPMVMWSLNEAERQGYPIDKAYQAELAEATIGGPDKLISAGMFDNPNGPVDTRPIARGVKTAAAFMSVAAQTLPSLTDVQKQTLRLIADSIVEKQQEDGSWEFFLRRPPINESQTTDHVWIAMALQSETNEKDSDSYRAALAKAIDWLEKTQLPQVHQDKVLRMILALRTGKSPEELKPMVDELLALQRPDGGWAQLDNLPSDAYSTGQSLYVLALVGMTLEQPAIQRAVDYLVATQNADGSWTMTSRASNDGSEGGMSKLLTPIQCGAGSWAVLGLSRLVPYGR